MRLVPRSLRRLRGRGYPVRFKITSSVIAKRRLPGARQVLLPVLLEAVALLLGVAQNQEELKIRRGPKIRRGHAYQNSGTRV